MKEFCDLHHKYNIGESGSLSWFLGIEVMRKNRHFSLSQNTHIKNILEKFDWKGFNQAKTPMMPNTILSLRENKEEDKNADKEIEKEENKHPYRSTVGSVIYLNTGTRPDVAYAVSQVYKYMHNPSQEDQLAVKHIYCYLVGTRSLGLRLEAKDYTIIGFFNTSWGDLPTGSR